MDSQLQRSLIIKLIAMYVGIFGENIDIDTMNIWIPWLFLQGRCDDNGNKITEPDASVIESTMKEISNTPIHIELYPDLQGYLNIGDLSMEYLEPFPNGEETHSYHLAIGDFVPDEPYRQAFNWWALMDYATGDISRGITVGGEPIALTELLKK